MSAERPKLRVTQVCVSPGVSAGRNSTPDILYVVTKDGSLWRVFGEPPVPSLAEYLERAKREPAETP